MKLDNHIDELISFLSSDLTIRAEEAAIRTMLAAFLKRIFNDGKATDGNSIGHYNEFFSIRYYEANFPGLNANAKGRLKEFEGQRIRYKELRKIAGRQADYVDLQFSDKLFNSVDVGIVNDHWVLGFTNMDRATIAHKNEVNFGKIIFQPSETELKLCRDVYFEYIRREIKRKFES